MSTLANVSFDCPSCGARVHGEIGLVVQLNKRRDLAQAVRDRTFNVLPCANCGGRTEVVRTVCLTDFERRLWLVVYPAWAEAHWRDLAGAVARGFQRNMEVAAPTFLREQAASWQVRVAFGPEAMREKLILGDAGLDDHVVELAKLTLLAGRVDRIGATVFVTEVADDHVVFRVSTPSGRVEEVDLARAAVRDAPPPPTAMGAAAWSATDLEVDPFVSFRRWFVVPRAADPLAFDLEGKAYAHAGGNPRLEWDD
jgi:hypothetical protein